MKRNNIFWFFAAASIAFTALVVVSLAFLFWQQLPPGERTLVARLAKEYIGYIFSAAVFLLAGLGFGLDWLFRLYILPLNKLAEETRLIHSVNPSHRIHLEGSRDIVRLVNTINEAADQYEFLNNRLNAEVQRARAEADEEKNILAAVMAELPEGVLICNTDGQILLYNKRARRYLVGEIGSLESSDVSPGRFIGLGRSVFGVIDKHLIVHALDEIARKLKSEDADVASYFVTMGADDRLLRVEAAPLLDYRRQFTGFILIFRDITQKMESGSRLNRLLRSLDRGTRASLASIRAAIEAIIAYPDMQSRQLQKFKEIIHGETINIGRIIDDTTTRHFRSLRSYWPLTQMNARDMLAATARKATDTLDLEVRTEEADEDLWLKVDSYSIVSALAFLQKQLVAETGSRRLTYKITKEGRFASFDIAWEGKPVPPDILRKWEDQTVTVDPQALSSTLKEIIEQHAAEIWSHAYKNSRQSYLRLLFPVADALENGRIRNLTILPKSRPEFFDFDLFSQPDQRPELDHRQLSELTYTVFDTETTGLDPQGGDEIISIGAVRIVNNRILREECFDQLVDPRRRIPEESIRIHGILPEMVAGQPPIEKALPLFFHFSDDTILVAHNAAFDMRMLQLKEDLSGVRFSNPVLDTMLLSAVVQPGQDNHDVEGIAARLGISIVGRHTALGDALVTAEIFLKLIPLLEKQGITTLGQARTASQKTYYARLKY